MKGYYKDFQIKDKTFRFVFTTHSLEQMVSRKIRDKEIMLSFEDIEIETISALIKNGNEIIISDKRMGFSMVLDFKHALTQSEGQAIKLVTVLDKTEVFAKLGTELIAI